jgi:serine protease Do
MVLYKTSLSRTSDVATQQHFGTRNQPVRHGDIVDNGPRFGAIPSMVKGLCRRPPRGRRKMNRFAISPLREVEMRPWVLSLVVCLAALATAPGQAQTPPSASASASPPLSPAETARRREPVASVVKVEARALDGATSASSLGARRSGSGVIIDERLVLTIGYLLLEVESVEVTTASGRKVPGTVAGYDHTSGFGLVRTALPMDGKRIELGDSDRVAERQKVLTVGQGEDEATELLVLSRKPFAGSWEYLLERPIFTFPPVNNWSGAALIAEDGRLVGIGSLIVNDAAGDRQGVPGNLFVPVNLLKPILGDLLANGRRSSPVQPWLGLTTEVVRGHLMVVRVSKSGPADQAGVDPGDIIMGVGGEKVADQADFYRRLWKLGPAGTEVKLRVLKGGDVRELPVKSIDRMEVLAKPTGV